ncbi:hypothetical protein P4O66_021208, partial [Electrophorus voltai]
VHDLLISDIQEEQIHNGREEEEISEEHDDEEYNIDNEEELHEDHQAERGIFVKEQALFWSSSPFVDQGRLAARNIMQMSPGPTRLVMSNAKDFASTFCLFITPDIEKIILEMTNMQGFHKYGEDWKKMDAIDLHAYVEGHCPFSQYMPCKPLKYGNKMLAACDVQSSYAWKMQVYTGKLKGGVPEKNQGMHVVPQATEDDDIHGRNTVKKNKPELPATLLTTKQRDIFSSKFAFTPTTMLASCCPKRNKNVFLMSTLHKDAKISHCEDRKLVIILEYGKNKAVENLNIKLQEEDCVLAAGNLYNIIDVSAYNALVFWNKNNPKWMPGKINKRRVFLEQLGKARVTPYIQRREHLPHTAASATIMRGIGAAAFLPSRGFGIGAGTLGLFALRGGSVLIRRRPHPASQPG